MPRTACCYYCTRRQMTWRVVWKILTSSERRVVRRARWRFMRDIFVVSSERHLRRWEKTMKLPLHFLVIFILLYFLPWCVSSCFSTHGPCFQIARLHLCRTTRRWSHKQNPPSQEQNKTLPSSQVYKKTRCTKQAYQHHYHSDGHFHRFDLLKHPQNFKRPCWNLHRRHPY